MFNHIFNDIFPVFHFLGQNDFLFRRQKIFFADFAKIKPNRVVHARIFVARNKAMFAVEFFFLLNDFRLVIFVIAVVLIFLVQIRVFFHNLDIVLRKKLEDSLHFWGIDKIRSQNLRDFVPRKHLLVLT